MEYDKRIQIRYLLELYFDGETTLEQERQLREYFAGDDVPADLEYARAMFGFFGAAAKDTSSADIILRFEEEWAAVRQELPIADVRELKKPASENSHRIVMAGWIYRVASVAAVVLLTIGITFTVTRYADQPTIYCYVNGQPVTDIDYATRQAEMAARILEGNMKTSAEGINALAEASKPIEQLGKVLQMIGVEPGEENQQ